MDSTKFSCQKCRYVYDPKSDMDEGIPFDELPGDWLCPKCFSADKSEFIAIKLEGEPNKNVAMKGVALTAQWAEETAKTEGKYLEWQ